MAQVFSLLLLAVMVYAIVDAIITDGSRIQHMPKVAWVLLIVFLPLIGSILWFVLGKERQPVRESQGSFGDPRRVQAVSRSSTESDLEAIEREIEFHEKQAEIRRLEAKLQARRQIDPNA
jgi:hypothetical protein